MILGTGIDIVQVSRIARIVERHAGSVERVFTSREIESLGHGLQRIQRMAARFAAKEALIKAAGGLHGGRLVDIEVLRQPGARAVAEVKGPLAAWIQGHGAVIRLSISHEKHYAVAQVILEVLP